MPTPFMGETLGGHIARELLRDWATLQVRYRFSDLARASMPRRRRRGWCTVVAPSGYFEIGADALFHLPQAA